ncbi:MAG TPA: trehalose-6-phosphate synthase [Steroidobacteraceae bacterium]|nr:trehalose-6-phosphate synthase [Steroidobacteraceae bacterium]
MSRIVHVSNRVAIPKGSTSPGGLAVVLAGTLRDAGGVWFGWSGETHPDSEPQPPLQEQLHQGTSYLTLSLPETMQELFYSGFANGSLWPLLHYFLDSFQYRDEEFQGYLAVNALFARELAPQLHRDDLVWVHDYHLMPCGQRLRSEGVTQPIGFFLHTPFPHYEVLRSLPVHRQLLESLLAYDLLGFQTETDQQSFLGAAAAVLGRECVTAGAAVSTAERLTRTGVFPVGVDLAYTTRAATKIAPSARVRDMMNGLRGRRLIIGVDRLDYSKGLLQRFAAFQLFLEECPEHRGKVTYVQIAPLGRQNVQAYGRIRHALERSAGNINGRFADVDWTPIRYLNRNFPHPTLLAFLRLAEVCLVTPLRDGMNLVAKEFIGAQDPGNPGVLVLSDRAGAAAELSDALLVNPYDTRGIARALREALAMPRQERRARHARLLEALRANDVLAWRSRFLASLSGRGEQLRLERAARMAH